MTIPLTHCLTPKMIDCLTAPELAHFLSLLEPTLWDIVTDSPYSGVVIHATEGDVLWEWVAATHNYCVTGVIDALRLQM